MLFLAGMAVVTRAKKTNWYAWQAAITDECNPPMPTGNFTFLIHMKTLSHWASRHAPLAIALITFCEVASAINGILLGASLLNKMPMADLQVGAAVLIGLAVGVRRLARTGGHTFSFGRWCLFGAFASNFFLFGLLGGSMAPRSQPQPFSAWGSGRVESPSDTLSRPDTLVRPDVVRPVSPATNSAAQSDRETGKRAGFVLLFVISIFLLFFSTGLACGLACSGYGFAAVAVFLLGLGFPAGGAYFISRLKEKPIKKASEMTTAERRQLGRRFFKAWGLTIAVFAGLILLLALF